MRRVVFSSTVSGGRSGSKAPSSKNAPSSFLLLVAMPGAPIVASLAGVGRKLYKKYIYIIYCRSSVPG